MKAHIDINKDSPVDAEAEHKAYGAEHYSDLNGTWPSPNTPAEEIRMDLIDLKSDDDTKLDERSKKENHDKDNNKNEKKNEDEKNE